MALSHRKSKRVDTPSVMKEEEKEPEPKVEQVVTTITSAAPTSAAAASATLRPITETFSSSPPTDEKPFDKMLREEYELALQREINKGVQRVSTRFTMLYSQERTPTDVVTDGLGNSSDYYENLMNTIQSGNTKAIGDSLEDVYQVLDGLRFTEMRPLVVIKQEYNQP